MGYKSLLRQASARSTKARQELADAKESESKVAADVLKYTEEKVDAQKKLSDAQEAKDAAREKKAQSEVNVAINLLKGAQANQDALKTAVATKQDQLSVAQEDENNVARQNTVGATKVLNEVNKAKTAVASEVSKAHDTQNKAAQMAASAR